MYWFEVKATKLWSAGGYWWCALRHDVIVKGVNLWKDMANGERQSQWLIVI